MLQTKQVFAEKMGVSVSVVNSWVYRYGLTVIQIGRRTYINEDDFLNWINEHKTIISEKPIKTQQVALPKRCRKSNLASKIRRIY